MIKRTDRHDLAVLTWAFLQQTHDRCMQRGWCSTAEKEQIIAMHKSYVALCASEPVKKSL